MTNLTALKSRIETLANVRTASVWQDRRLYVNLSGAVRGYKGDTGWKVWFDATDGRWHAEKADRRAVTSAAFGAILDEFLAAANAALVEPKPTIEYVAYEGLGAVYRIAADVAPAYLVMIRNTFGVVTGNSHTDLSTAAAEAEYMAQHYGCETAVVSRAA